MKSIKYLYDNNFSHSRTHFFQTIVTIDWLAEPTFQTGKWEVIVLTNFGDFPIIIECNSIEDCQELEKLISNFIFNPKFKSLDLCEWQRTHRAPVVKEDLEKSDKGS